VTALLEEEARENCEPEPRRIVLTPEKIAARGKSTRAIHEKQAVVEEPRGMRRAREGGTAAEADAVGVRREAVRFAEDSKMDPSNCLMETLVLRENQEGIRIRRSPGDYAKHLPWVLERVFLQTLCGPVNDEQGRCASSDVRGNGGRCVSGDAPGSRDQYMRGNAPGDRSRCASSNVRGNGGRCVSGDAPGSRDQYVRGNARGDRSRYASSDVRGNGGRCVSGNAPGSRDQYVRGNARGDRSRCASSKVQGNRGRCVSSGVRQSGDPGGGPEPEADYEPACGKLLGVLDEIQVLNRATEARMPGPAVMRAWEVTGEQATVATAASVGEQVQKTMILFNPHGSPPIMWEGGEDESALKDIRKQFAAQRVPAQLPSSFQPEPRREASSAERPKEPIQGKVSGRPPSRPEKASCLRTGNFAVTEKTRCTTAGETRHQTRRLPEWGQCPRRMRSEDAGELGKQPKWQRR
jgi:hypothetical protein